LICPQQSGPPGISSRRTPLPNRPTPPNNAPFIPPLPRFTPPLSPRHIQHRHIIDQKDDEKEVVLTIHWTGGRHTEIRVSRISTGRYPQDRHPSPVEVIRNLGGQWPDRELAVTMNRMRCRSTEGGTWTASRVHHGYFAGI